MRNYSTRQTIKWLEEEIIRLRAKLKSQSGGITEELDPNFNSSPASDITSGDVTFIQAKDYNSLNNKPNLALKADLVGGKVPESQLPQSIPQIEIVSSDTYTLVPTKKVVMLTLEGSNTVVNLPLISDTIGMIIFITNTTSNISAATCNVADNNGIWEGGVLLTHSDVAPNSVMRIINDGLKYRVL